MLELRPELPSSYSGFSAQQLIESEGFYKGFAFILTAHEGDALRADTTSASGM